MITIRRTKGYARWTDRPRDGWFVPGIMNTATKYLYSNAQVGARARLTALEQIEDKNTIALLGELGSLDGLDCLEIGAGAGSIAEWLSGQVGDAGSVTATDIEPVYLSNATYSVLRHDISTEKLPRENFDVAHIRHVLIHLDDPTSVLGKIAASLKPGGALLVEESDLSSWRVWPGSPAKLQEEFSAGVDTVLRTYEQRGMNITLGRALPQLVHDAGLIIGQRKDFRRVVAAGSPEAGYQRETAIQLSEALGAGQPGFEEISRLAECLLDPGLTYTSRTTVSVLARKPGRPAARN